MWAPALNAQMLNGQLLPQGCNDPRLVHAFSAIPRENFTTPQDKPFAYVDAPVAMGEKRFMLSPVMQNHLIMAARIQPHERVLDVACGTGYTTALLSFLCTTVTGLESDKTLASQAKKNLQTLDIQNAQIICDDFNHPQGTYDVIILEGSLETAPATLLNQLTPTGRLVMYQHGTMGPWSRLTLCTRTHTQTLTEGGAPHLDALFGKTLSCN